MRPKPRHLGELSKLDWSSNGEARARPLDSRWLESYGRLLNARTYDEIPHQNIYGQRLRSLGEASMLPRAITCKSDNLRRRILGHRESTT
jgi:hypothetical protein